MSRAPLWLSSVACLAAAVALAIAASDTGGAVVVPESTAGAVPDSTDVRARIFALERRLEALAATAAAGARADAAPAPTANAADTGAVEARLAAVEAAVAALRSDLAALGPMPDTAAGIVQALADQNLFGPGASPAHVQRRRELWQRFLELAPRDPQAPRMLEQACGDLLATDPGAAIELLDRHRHSVALAPLRVDYLRANALSLLGQGDGARAIFGRLAGDRSLSEVERVDAAFWHAHTWKQQGRYDEARREFESLIAHYGADRRAEVVSIVDGARGQIAEMERWQGR
ncbi:MAG: hypothetical protein JNL08_06855 [Planctomycetes bacterium]|nr:hypothetical protein [Planctomycetota bacterium]